MSGRNERVSVVSPMATSAGLVTTTGSDEFLEARRSSPAVHSIEYFSGRKGYDPNFLGRVIPLPTLTDRALRFGSVAPVSGTQDNVLRYEHFLIVFNAERRLAFFTAVNIDGSQSVNLGRDDAWYPHSALQLLRHILVTKTRQFDDTTDRNSLIAVTQN